jgi:hypothetical protein
MRLRVVAACAAPVLCSTFGCGSDGPPSTSTPSPFSLTVSAPGPNGPAPFGGAFVALDRADGSRSEAATGSDGRVAFDGVDVQSGTYSFTVAAPGYVAITNANVGQLGDWRLTLTPFGEDESLLDVTGIVHGKSNPDHFVSVTTSAPSSIGFDGIGPEYAIRVRGGAFTAFVTEYWYGPGLSSSQGESLAFVSWASYSMSAAAGANVVDLTLPGSGQPPQGSSALVGQSLLPRTGTGTMSVPSTMHGASGHLRVTSDQSDGSAFLGGATSVVAAPNGSDLVYEAEYIVPSGTSVSTTYWLALNDSYSYAYRDLAPSGPVSLVDPPSLASPLPLYGDLAVRSGASSAVLSVAVASDDSSIGWRIFDAGGSSGTLRMPKLPSGIDPREVLGTGRVTARAVVCVPDAAGKCSDVGVSAASDLVAQ